MASNGGHVATLGLAVDAHIEAGKVATFGLVVDALCTQCFEGVVSTLGLLVDAYERDLFDVRAVNAKVSDLFDRIAVEEARVRDLFDAGDVPDNETRGFVATLTGFRAEIKACRLDIDRRNVLDALVYPDPADTIRLWKWERSLRVALVTVDRQLRVDQEIARELLDNRPGQTYVTRAGDTLQSIAVRFFGDAGEWRRVVEANAGLDVGEVAPGTVLNIPEGD